jgi:hypothetical protein
VKDQWPKRLTGHNQNGRWVGLPGRTTGSGIHKPHRGTDANQAGRILLHRQLGKPYASHIRGIPTVRKGDGAEGRRWWKKRTPPRNRAERAADAEIPNPKGGRLPFGPHGREAVEGPNLWGRETVDSSTERTKGPTQPVMDAEVGHGHGHIFRASMRGKSFCRQRYAIGKSICTSPFDRLRA